MIINAEKLLLRAIPNGIISGKCCCTGLLEIKCPAKGSLRAMTEEEIARKDNYHLEIGGNDQVSLKINSPWFTQIHTSLAVSGYAWCDFVLFTQKSPHLTAEKIPFDSTFFKRK